jgi:catechol 2,3-dioxygenase-like lactoylglutathione lyase family enzyme
MAIEIDHIGVSVSDYEKSKAFYAAAMAPLRMIAIMEFSSAETGNEPVVGFGADDKPFLWISGGGRTVPHTHVAIRAETRDQVDGFYAAALAAGGTDNGAPGLRPHYHENYYGAFVLDPDGHNIEAVVHTPPGAAKAARKPARKTSAKARGRAAARKPAKRTVTRKTAPKRKPAAKRMSVRRGKKK